MSRIFIPKTCRVGFQDREDTFTKRLAYVIYYDAKGKLRKEVSWKGWCDKKIEARDFDNEPTSGFVLNKGIRRYNWSHFGSGRSMIRIYDPRGVEFEITPDNLIGLLMHTDCSKREIQGDLVYAWKGTEILLLPCCSEEYESAKTFTSLQGKRIGARELVEGRTYITKDVEHLVYIGYHMYYEEKYVRGDWRSKTRSGKKRHIFYDIKREAFLFLSNIPNTISAVADENCHNQFANLVDDYLGLKEASVVVSWERRPLPKNWWDEKSKKDHHYWDAYSYVEHNGKIHRARINIGRGGGYYEPEKNKGEFVYHLSDIIHEDGSTESFWESTERLVEDKSLFFDLYAKMGNGRTAKWGR